MNISKAYQQVINWNLTHGIEGNIERQQFFVQCEAQEHHEAKGEAKLFELGDWFFTASYLDYLVKQADKEYHTSLQDCINLIREHKAMPYVMAVIESNWTKYIRSSETTLLGMAKEAEAIKHKYGIRYTHVVPRRVGEWFMIVGKEQGHEKVLKPSTFKPANELLSLTIVN